MSEEEVTQLESQLEEEHRQSIIAAAAAKKEEAAAAASAAAAAAAEGGAVDGSTLEPAAESAMEPEVEAAEAAPEPNITEEDIKAGWLRAKLQVYSATNAQLEGRKPFEDLIKRTYFHVKPQEVSQVNMGMGQVVSRAFRDFMLW